MCWIQVVFCFGLFFNQSKSSKTTPEHSWQKKFRVIRKCLWQTCVVLELPWNKMVNKKKLPTRNFLISNQYLNGQFYFKSISNIVINVWRKNIHVFLSVLPHTIKSISRLTVLKVGLQVPARLVKWSVGKFISYLCFFHFWRLCLAWAWAQYNCWRCSTSKAIVK